MTDQPLVEAIDLSVDYKVARGQRTRVIRAVRHLNLKIIAGETLALVGESGSGKSTLGRTLVRLIRPSGGTVQFDGADVFSLQRASLKRFRADVQVVFQNPFQSLNPKMTIGATLGEVLAVWGRYREGVAGQSIGALLAGVHLPASYARKYPHELSGGERQRVAIARAMAVRPRLLIADEAVSALDVGASARVLNLLQELRETTGLTTLFITHDIGLARLIADRIAVMYVGSLVDVGDPDAVFERPTHEYTKALIESRLTMDPDAAHGADDNGQPQVPGPRPVSDDSGEIRNIAPGSTADATDL
jgi:ABC-type glutathione transport system ATPase component